MEREELVQKVKRFIDEHVEGPKFTIASRKELAPELIICFVDSKGELQTLDTPGVEIFFRNNTMKDKLPGFIESIITALRNNDNGDLPEVLTDPVGVILVSDIYRANVPAGDRTARQVIEEELPPSQRPDRTEALMFSCHLKDYSFIRMYPYTREGQYITFQDMEEMEGDIGEGRFANLFPS